MGYQLNDDMSAENVVKALKLLLRIEKSKNRLFIIQTGGYSIVPNLYQAVLSKHHTDPSMTDGYDCYQNALAERINGILKNEFLGSVN